MNLKDRSLANECAVMRNHIFKETVGQGFLDFQDKMDNSDKMIIWERSVRMTNQILKEKQDRAF